MTTASASSRSAAVSSAAEPSITEYVSQAVLQEVQDSFCSATGLNIGILGADGLPVTVPTDVEDRERLTGALDGTLELDAEAIGDLTAPIFVGSRQMGAIVFNLSVWPPPAEAARDAMQALGARLHLPEEAVELLFREVQRALVPTRGTIVQALQTLADSIGRMCAQELHLRQRVRELSALYRLSTLLAGQRDLQHTLQAAARTAVDVMGVKACSIRMLDEGKDQLITRAVANLSESYISKGAIHLSRSLIDREALAGHVVYVADMATDARVLYPDDARREQLASILTAGMIYQGEPVGVMRLYTGETRTFTEFEEKLLQAMAQILAAAIQKSKLDAEHLEAQRVQRQLVMAADVQRRMLPRNMPQIPGLDIAARYVPSSELGGDFYDFIWLGGHLGIAIGDVVGKGIAASLLMAGVRSALRAYAQDLYEIQEVMRRVNVAMTRDTLISEFATLFYGVLDPKTLRLTYCNAGHDPPMLLRGGRISELSTGGMIIGIDEHQDYQIGILQFEPGDLLLCYTDGLVDAMNFHQKRFGRDRVREALRGPEHASANDAVNHFIWEMRRFTGLARNTDDTTVVVIKVT